MNPLPTRLFPPRLPPRWPPKQPGPIEYTGTLPRITVVTPSYNQAEFLETTIRSVLEEGYPALDYYIIDGGSRDGSTDIIRHYEPWLSGWVSETDRGQVNAIAKGLASAQGEWFNWINSDDLLAPGALWEVARAPDCDLVAGQTQNFYADRLARRRASRDFTARNFIRIPVESRVRWHQPGIWYRTAALRDVGIDETLHYRFDLDLLIRYCQRYPKIHYLQALMAYFRLHGSSKTVSQAARFEQEHLRLLENLLARADDAALHDDARAALQALSWRSRLEALQADPSPRLTRALSLLREAGRTPGAWRINATAETLGRILFRKRLDQAG